MDNPKKRRADGKRAALKQDHEREYLAGVLEEARTRLAETQRVLTRAITRLGAGYPMKRPAKRG